MMTTNSRPARSFRIRPILGLSWLLLSRNIMSWIWLAVALNFLSFVAIAALDYIPRYFEDLFGVDLLDYEQTKTLVALIGEVLPPIIFTATIGNQSFAHNFLSIMVCVTLLYFVLLQITVNQIIHDLMAKEGGQTTSGEFAKHLRNINSLMSPAVVFDKNIGRRFRRVSGLLLVYFMMLVAVLWIVWEIAGTSANIASSTLRTLFLVSLILLADVVLLYFIGRLSLAIPASINEDKAMFACIERSWRMSKSCAVRVPVMNLIAWLLASVVLFVFTVPVTLFGAASLLPFVIWVVGLILFPLVPTILMSVTYFTLHLDIVRDESK